MGVVATLAVVGALVLVDGVWGDVASQRWFSTGLGLAALMVVGVLVSSATAVLAGYLAFRGLGRDLDDLRYGTRMLAEGHLHFRWKERGLQETDELRAQLNQMADRWQDQLTLLRGLAEEKEALAEKAREVGVMAERQRLARELHDAVSQQLFALAMTAAAVNRVLDTNVALAKEKMTAIETMAQKALGEMRALLMHLRPIELGDQPLGTAVQSMLSEIEKKGLLRCQADIDPDLELSRAVEANLLRIFQEATANTLRHGHASLLKVRLAADAAGVRLSVEDDGVGFDSDKSGVGTVSYGLSTMKERAQECGGSVRVVSVQGRGTRVDVRIPRL